MADCMIPVPMTEAERLNLIAAAVKLSWADETFVPLSVRFKAARLADAFVKAWDAEHPRPPVPSTEKTQ